MVKPSRGKQGRCHASSRGARGGRGPARPLGGGAAVGLCAALGYPAQPGAPRLAGACPLGEARPRLERCFLRHAEGLAGVRRLVEQALAGRLGPGIIGCDSWAWAYLQHTLALPEGQAFTLQPFDGADLDRYFAAAARHGCGHLLAERTYLTDPL
ncbi:hypothetical protein [uncultured Halomonas sp.]|uniref:hypothetical protein n=1 Tax=uncultured Halomonas sp. TaxID=173971 RepID=UPI002607590C|nr:hypothetical protein [uncultured Halomonas sp.]